VPCLNPAIDDCPDPCRCVHFDIFDRITHCSQFVSAITGLRRPLRNFPHSGELPGTLTMVQCEKREFNLLDVAGYKPGLLGKLILKAVSKTIFEKPYSEIRPPNITLRKNQWRDSPRYSVLGQVGAGNAQ
jgi:hypothetical protein